MAISSRPRYYIISMKYATITITRAAYRAAAVILAALIIAGWGCGGQRSERPNENQRVLSDTLRWTSGAVTATLSPDGMLRVSGAGAMAEFTITTVEPPPSPPTPPPWRNYESLITDLVIEEGVTHITEYAFAWLGELGSVTIPGSVAVIGYNAFAGCPSLTSIMVAVDNAHYSSKDGALFSKSQDTLILFPRSRQGAYMIPSTVTNIVDRIFNDAVGPTMITIPASVVSIGLANIFIGCTALTSINVEDGNPVYSSVDGVLFNKTKDTLIIYPIAKRGTYIIPDGVTTIGRSAFFGCTGLTSVTIPSSVTEIVRSAFRYCINLTSVMIPNSITEIGYDAFFGCKSLMSVTIPLSVTRIAESTFWRCTKLTSVTIPERMISIGDMAFDRCSTLISVTSLNPVPPDIGREAFGDLPSAACLYVPARSINAYRTRWTAFNCVKAIAETGDL